MTMNALISKEIDRLKERLLFLGGKVEENYDGAVAAVENRDGALARQVIEADNEVDLLEVELEEECLKILALYQPVARDLRFIITTLKVNNDLERIDDLSGSIAEHALFFADKPQCRLPFDFSRMASLTRRMLKDSLDSLVELDEEKAVRVREADDAVDDLNRSMYDAARRQILDEPEEVEFVMHAMGMRRAFERIADQTTNIAEDVIYLISGQIVRH